VNVNVSAFDAGKHSGLPVMADARVALEQLRDGLAGWRCEREWEARAKGESVAWGEEVARVVSLDGDHGGPPTQAQIIKEINDAAGETGVVVCAAGSAPGDLHKLWRARDPAGKGYHVEYGYSCMGYEIPGGMGVKLAAPERDVYVLIGDGSYLMLPGELVSAVAQRVPIVIVLVDNHGYASIGALSRSLGSAGFGTLYRFSDNGSVPLDPASTDVLPLDLAANAESLGARVVRATTIAELREGLAGARGADGPVVIHIEADRYRGVPGYESWWDVPVAEVSEEETVRAAREAYDEAHTQQRQYLR
jgi:3D-(3,5/4)-trihydroxycyclohexane-1,2-dione acylhydrolase (decyclizing)